MEKSIHSAAYRRLLQLLRSSRVDAGLTQEGLADALGQTQSWVSKVERGERRLDLVELRTICNALDIDIVRFVKKFEATFNR